MMEPIIGMIIGLLFPVAALIGAVLKRGHLQQGANVVGQAQQEIVSLITAEKKGGTDELQQRLVVILNGALEKLGQQRNTSDWINQLSFIRNNVLSAHPNPMPNALSARRRVYSFPPANSIDALLIAVLGVSVYAVFPDAMAGNGIWIALFSNFLLSFVALLIMQDNQRDQEKTSLTIRQLAAYGTQPFQARTLETRITDVLQRVQTNGEQLEVALQKHRETIADMPLAIQDTIAREVEKGLLPTVKSVATFSTDITHSYETMGNALQKSHQDFVQLLSLLPNMERIPNWLHEVSISAKLSHPKRNKISQSYRSKVGHFASKISR